MKLWICGFGLALAMPAFGKDEAAIWDLEPSPEYFSGFYERVGRSAKEAPQFLNDIWQIAPAADGAGIVLKSCADPEAETILLRPDAAFEMPMLGGVADDAAIWCQFFNDLNNYAILNCSTEAGARLTFWPQTDDDPALCQAN